MDSRDNVWTYIKASKYDKNPSLDDKKFLKSLRSLVNAFYQDYSFVKNKTDTKFRKKKFHFHGTCCKIKFVPSTHNYGGFLSKVQYGIIRFSLVEPRAPTIGIKFYNTNGDTEDLVLVPHENEQEDPSSFNGIKDTFNPIVYRTWFDVPIHRHNNINIIQAVTFPIFREVSKVFSIKFQHLFDEPPKILNLVPCEKMILPNIENGKKLFNFYSEDKWIGTISAESIAIQSEYGDYNLHFQHNLVNPLKSLYPLSLLPRWIEIIFIIPNTLLKNYTPLTFYYSVYIIIGIILFRKLNHFK